jgi:hypothetical protein
MLELGPPGSVRGVTATSILTANLSDSAPTPVASGRTAVGVAAVIPPPRGDFQRIQKAS